MQKTINEDQMRKTQTRDFDNSTNQENKIFEIMFVRNDEDKSVEVVESATIDFNAIIENLGEGNSIFIAPKIQGNFPSKKKQKSHSYINHV